MIVRCFSIIDEDQGHSGALVVGLVIISYHTTIGDVEEIIAIYDLLIFVRS